MHLLSSVSMWLLLMLSITGQVMANQMLLLLNNSSDSRHGEGDVDMQILAVLQHVAKPELMIEPLRLGDARSWLLLREDSRYCALSKIWTKERAEFLHYSAKPVSVYPPLLLVSQRGLAEGPIDLPDLLQQNPTMKIGLVHGRSYGEQLDQQIRQFPRNFYLLSGELAADALLQMLSRDRLDAVIEFAAVVRRHEQETSQSESLIRHQLLHQPVIKGYLVCHKSPQGQQLIDIIDQKMLLPYYRNTVFMLHQDYFSVEDFAMIESELAQIFKPGMNSF